MAWQGIPFLMHEFDQTLGNAFLGFQPLKVLVEMSPKASADNSALWAAFIGAAVSGLVALLSQYISMLSRIEDRNHQSRLMKYQLLLTIKQTWADDLRNEVANLISLSTAVYNLYSTLNELFDKNLAPSESYDKAFEAQMEKKTRNREGKS